MQRPFLCFICHTTHLGACALTTIVKLVVSANEMPLETRRDETRPLTRQLDLLFDSCDNAPLARAIVSSYISADKHESHDETLR